MPTEHRLKTWPEYFEAVWSRKKGFEIRNNDRDFRVGDILVLEEFDPARSLYTGRMVRARVGYVLAGEDAERFGLKSGYCVINIDALSRVHRSE